MSTLTPLETTDAVKPPRKKGWVGPAMLGLVLVAGAGAWWKFAPAGEGKGARAAHGQAAGGGRRGRGKPEGPVPVMVGTVKPMDVPLVVRSVGAIAASASVAIRAQISAPITRIGFTEGQPVKQGQLLFELDAGPMVADMRRAEAQLARDRAQLGQAESDARRSTSLVAQGYLARQAGEQAGSAVAALAATVMADRAAVDSARIQAGYATIRAPFAGVAGDRLTDVGNMARAGDTNPLLTIHKVSPAYVAFSIPPAELERVRAAYKGRKLPLTATPRGGAPHPGTLTFIDHAVDASTGTLRLKGTLPNADGGLVPGQFVDVALEIDVEKAAVVAPSAAILSGQDGHYAFVVVPDKKVGLRKVVVARHAGDLEVIAEGLKPGDQVVTDGTLQLRDGSQIDVRDTLQPKVKPGGGGKRRKGQAG